MNKDRLLSTKETAERLDCAMSTLWRWLKEIPDFPRMVRTGIRKRGFYESEVDAYLKRRRSEVEAYRDGALRESRG